MHGRAGYLDPALRLPHLPVDQVCRLQDFGEPERADHRMTTDSQRRSVVPIRRTRKSIKVEKAIVLRSEGWTWDQIAQEFGWKDRRVAAHYVYSYLSERAKHANSNVEAHRQELLDKLDQLEKECWDVLKRKHIMVSQGRIVGRKDPDTGEIEELEDDAPVLQAADRILKIIERKAKLLGVDMTADTQVGIAVQYNILGVDASDLS